MSAATAGSKTKNSSPAIVALNFSLAERISNESKMSLSDGGKLRNQDSYIYICDIMVFNSQRAAFLLDPG